MAEKGSQIGGVFVRVGADTTDLQRGLTQAGSSVKQFASVAKTAAIAVTAFTAVAATLATGLYSMARAGMNAIDAQAKLARQLDGTIGGVRGLQLAANDAGVATETMNGALQRMNAQLGEARTGTGKAAEALSALGLSAQQLSGMDVDQRIATIADRIQALGLSSDQTGKVLRDLGIRQAELINLMRQGGDAIRNARGEIEDYGLAVSDIDSAQIEAANDAMSRLSLVGESLRTMLAIKLAPALLEIAQRFNNVTREIFKAIGKTEDMDEAAAGLGTNTAIVDFAYAAGKAIASLLDTLNLAVKGFNVVKTSFQAAWNDIKAVLAEQGMDKSGLAKMIDPEAFAERQAEYDKVMKDRADGLKAAEGARKAFSEAGSFFADAFEEGWAQDLPTITVPGKQGGGGILPDAGDGGAGKKKADDTAARERAAYIENLNQRLEALRDFTASATELEIKAYLDRVDQLSEIYNAGLVSDEERKELALDLEEQHQQALTDIAAKGEQDRLANVERAVQLEKQARSAMVNNAIGFLDQLAGKSKAAAIASIALTKGLAIAETISWTQVAAARALAELGPIAGPPVAAAIEAKGAVSVALIAAQGIAQAAGVMSAKSGSMQGGASGSIGGQSSAPSSNAQSSVPNQVVTINMQGEVFDRKMVRSLIEQINEATSDGARLRLA